MIVISDFFFWHNNVGKSLRLVLAVVEHEQAADKRVVL
jgi:hypothetical protein